MKKIFVMVGIFIAFSLTTQLLAQEKNPKRHDKPFDFKIDKFPPDYLGNNIVDVYNKFQKMKPSKGEYETTDDYEKRLKNFDLTRIYAFKLAPDYGIKIKQYNADNKSLSITSSWYYPGDAVSEVHTLVVKTSSIEKGFYVGENAFGVKRMITKYLQSLYAIRVTNPEKFDAGFWSFFLYISRYLNIANLDAHEAKNLKSNLAVLIVCVADINSYRSAHLLTFKDTTHYTPKIDSLYDKILNKYWINSKILEIWVYNIKTGKIFLKEKIDGI